MIFFTSILQAKRLRFHLFNKAIMTVVLKHCPLSSSSTPTLRTEIRARFVSLFNLYKDNVAWESGQKEAVLKLMDSTERGHFSLKQRQDHTKRPPEKGTNWIPLWVVAGFFVTFLTYRYVAEPAYQWIRKPRVPVQQKV